MREKTAKKGGTLTIRISDVARRRLEMAKQALPYEVSITAIVERGIHLALEEMQAMANQRTEARDA